MKDWLLYEIERHRTLSVAWTMTTSCALPLILVFSPRHTHIPKCYVVDVGALSSSEFPFNETLIQVDVEQWTKFMILCYVLHVLASLFACLGVLQTSFREGTILSTV